MVKWNSDWREVNKNYSYAITEGESKRTNIAPSNTWLDSHRNEEQKVEVKAAGC